MKKTICAILSLVLCLSLAACGSKQVPTEAATEAVTEAVTEAAPQSVEITMDNWEQYFELIPAADASSQGEAWALGYALVLREEYRYVSGTVDFELAYDVEQRPFEGDAETMTWTLGEPLEPDHELLPGAKTFGLQDYRENTDMKLFTGTVAAVCLPGAVMTREDGTQVAEVPVNGEILHAEGSLVLE